MDKSGKMLILAILVIALASGGFSWWFRWSATHRASDFWGPDAATTIRDAKRVTAAKIDHYDSEKPDEVHRAEVFDASQAKGLIHLKQALLEDQSYSWANVETPGPFTARWLLEFQPPSSSASNSDVQVLFDEACTRFYFVSAGRRSTVVECSARFSSGMSTMFAEWFPPASN